MKHFFALAVLLLAIALPQARAQQDPDSQYVAIYGQIQQADSLQSSGQPRLALDGFVAAQARLQKFQKIYPDWSQKIIGYRLKYVAEKIAGLAAQFPPPLQGVTPQMKPAATNINSPAPAADAGSPPDGLRAQLQNSQSDNATLQAKLKEALAVQPAAVDSGELARAQAQVQSLMKENDLLKASQAQTPAGLPRQSEASADAVVTNAVETPVPNSELTNLQAQVASLQSEIQVGALEKLALENRIRQLQTPAAVSPPVAPPSQPSGEMTGGTATPPAQPAAGEAQAVTNAPDAQALPAQPEPPPAANSDVVKKSINELPAGSAELVAEAQNYFAAKEFDKAAADYQKILQLAPDNALALGNLAAIELEQGNLDNAETHIKSALAQNPDDAYDLSILGYLKFRQQKFDDAFDALSRAEKLDPKNAEIQNYLGVTLSRKGRHAQAEAALRKAIEIQPDYAAAHNNLAVVYISQQPPSAGLARLEYQKAVELGQPRNPDLEKLLAGKGAPVNPQ